MVDQRLPEFENPPVVETVHGVQFQEIRGLGSGRLGAFWRSLGDDWPQVDDAPPLPPQFERFGNVGWGQSAMSLALSKSPRCRLMIRNAAKDRMIQVQNGQLHWNWLKQEDAEYPRYVTIRQEFDAVLKRFTEFLETENVGAIRPVQWEITYLNHLPRGSVWQDPADWPRLFPALPMVQTALSSLVAESFEGQWHYGIPEQRGRLHIQISHEKKPDRDDDERLVVTLTARGPATDAETVCQGLDLGHEAIVTAFKELTSADAHRYWRLQA